MRFTAVIPVRGELRRIHFDAPNPDDARVVAMACNAALEHQEPGELESQACVAYGMKKARELLGGVSRATIYNWLATGRLERVQGTRKVLITRSSIEGIC